MAFACAGVGITGDTTGKLAFACGGVGGGGVVTLGCMSDACGCGVGVVPELVRKDSPLRGRIEQVETKRPPRGYHVSLCAKERTLGRRTVAALWELAPATTSL